MKKLNSVKLKKNQVIKIKTVRNLFGEYQGLAKVTLEELDHIWKYNGYICVVELLEPHNLDTNRIAIEPMDIVQSN